MPALTILVVDDDPLIRASLEERHRAERFALVEAATAAEAITDRDLDEQVEAGHFRSDLVAPESEQCGSRSQSSVTPGQRPGTVDRGRAETSA